MNRHRYEPVPHRDQDIINLDALANNASYQYNTGLPGSVPTSAAPSYSAPSIRSIQTSPPPSFHTVSRTGTPRATLRGGEGAELWGVATSTGGALTEPICSSNDTLETIKELRQRVTKLEESLGRLLLEKDEANSTGKSSHCCVTFTDASPEMESIMARNGDHCCVSFKSSRGLDLQKRSARIGALVIGAVAMMGLIVILAVLTNSPKSNRGFDLN